jgi:two-component system response regulator
VSNVLARGRPVEVLLVEDNPDDVELMRIGFRRAKFAVNLHHVGNGEECMAFLRREAPYTDVPRPDLVLLDLNMPRMDGREVLAEIDKDEALSHIPVVVLTSSDADSDVLASYRLSCSSYIVKPVDFEQFSSVVRGIGDYWFTLVVLPPDA